jgi:DNA excision repair protein ERCC-2
VEIDLEARRVSASVGELVGEGEQRSIGLTGSGMSRLWIGQELHRRLQQEMVEADPDYRAEVPLTLELDIDGWTLVVSGRADGIAPGGDGPPRVDEIKSLHFAVDLNNLFAVERLERFRHQVRLYALMLSTEEQQATARLILADIVSGDSRHEDVAWTPDEVLARLRIIVHRVVAAETRRRARLAELRVAAEALPFPHPELRPGQDEIVDAARAALEDEQHLLVRAPTGCGKTAAALYPALRTALARGHRVYYLTAKTLQQRLAVDTARAMQEGLFRSLQLRAKSKMCAATETICHEEHCAYARDYGLKLIHTGLVDHLLAEAEHLDPDHIYETARHHEVCPFEVSLDLLPEVDLVVCDYNYVFDPNIGLSALLGGGSLRNAVLIIDEAHNLVDRSREYYSPTLRLSEVRRARSFLDRRDAPAFVALRGLMDTLIELIRTAVADVLGEHTTATAEVDLPVQDLGTLRMALDGAMLQYFIYKRENDLWLADDPAVEVFYALTHFHRVLLLGGEEFIHLATRDDDGDEELKVFCRDASRFLGQLLDASAGAIAMSATLEPFEFFRDLLGFDPERTGTLHLPSPFPTSHRLVLSIDDVDTTYRHRRAHFDGIAHWVARLLPARRNVLALFPSYAFLEAIRDRLPSVAHTLLVQRPGTSDSGQRELLEALESNGSHLVLAVLGGLFAEGVDYPGDMLSEVIVVSPGLPQFNVERQLLKDYYQEVYGHGFSYAYLIPGLTRVVQAAGRLIRSAEDRGVIVLICRRFQDVRYARLLPDEWTDGDPASMLSPDPEAAIEAFFSVD